MTRCPKSEALTLLALALLLSPATSFGQPDSPGPPNLLAQARTYPSAAMQSEPADAERSALIALERESHRWWLERNTQALAGLFAEDYRFVAPNGAVEDKAFVLAGTEPASVRMLQVESMRMEPEEVILSGNRAIVLGVIEMKATVAGRPAPERLRVLSVFERSDAEADWRLAARSTTPVLRPPAAQN